MSSFMEDKKKMWGSTIFLAALMAGTFFFLLRDISWPMLLGTLRKVNPLFILVGFALMVSFVACEALNIRIILRQVGLRIPFFRCLQRPFFHLLYFRKGKLLHPVIEPVAGCAGWNLPDHRLMVPEDFSVIQVKIIIPHRSHVA